MESAGLGCAIPGGRERPWGASHLHPHPTHRGSTSSEGSSLGQSAEPRPAELSPADLPAPSRGLGDLPTRLPSPPLSSLLIPLHVHSLTLTVHVVKSAPSWDVRAAKRNFRRAACYHCLLEEISEDIIQDKMPRF